MTFTRLSTVAEVADIIGRSIENEGVPLMMPSTDSARLSAVIAKELAALGLLVHDEAMPRPAVYYDSDRNGGTP